MKILGTIGILALVAGLLLGGAGSAFAQDGPPGKRHGFFGTVDSVDGYVVTLVTKQGLTVKVTLTDTAKYKVPGETKGTVDRDAFITAIGVGKRIAVLAADVVEVVPDEFTATAIRLMLIPSPAHHRYLHAHRVGVVDDFIAGEDGKIVIIDRDGESHEFGVSDDTIYRPADKDATDIVVGESYVTVVTKGDPKAGPIAKAIVLHEKIAD